MADKIREAIKALAIEHVSSGLSLGIITVSVGAISMVPEVNGDLVAFVRAADRALYQSKLQGRDRITVAKVLENQPTQEIQLP